MRPWAVPGFLSSVMSDESAPLLSPPQRKLVGFALAFGALCAIAALLYLAIPGLAIGQWFWQEGVASLGATRAGLYLYLEPLATLALAVPLLGEPCGPLIALGGGLVLAGVYV